MMKLNVVLKRRYNSPFRKDIKHKYLNCFIIIKSSRQRYLKSSNGVKSIYANKNLKRILNEY